MIYSHDKRFLLSIRAPKVTNKYVTTNYNESEAIPGREQKMMIIGGHKEKLKVFWGKEDKIILETMRNYLIQSILFWLITIIMAIFAYKIYNQ